MVLTFLMHKHKHDVDYNKCLPSPPSELHRLNSHTCHPTCRSNQYTQRVILKFFPDNIGSHVLPHFYFVIFGHNITWLSLIDEKNMKPQFFFTCILLFLEFGAPNLPEMAEILGLPSCHPLCQGMVDPTANNMTFTVKNRSLITALVLVTKWYSNPLLKLER